MTVLSKRFSGASRGETEMSEQQDRERKIAEDWLSFHPEFKTGKENSTLIGNFLMEKNWDFSHANLERAYQALKAQGHFTTPVEEEPLPEVPGMHEPLI